MIKKPIILAILCLAIVSCQKRLTSTNEAARLASSTDTPQHTITASSTLQPGIDLIKCTTVFAGPGNQSFDEVSEICDGETLAPVGIFGDFLAVEGPGETFGFVWQGDLRTIPKDVAVIDRGDVPADSVDLLDFVFHPGALAGEGILKVQALDDEWFSMDIGPLPGSTHFELQTQFSSKGFGAVVFSGAAPGLGEWWSVPRLVIADDHLDLRNGESESSLIRLELPGLGNHLISIVFDDPNGKSFNICNEEGIRITSMNLNELRTVHFENGLFPSGELYFGVLVSPQSGLTVSDLILSKPPSGEYADEGDQSPGLRNFVVNSDFLIGASGVAYRFQELQYQDIIAREYNVLKTIAFEMDDMWLAPEIYNFKRADAMVAFAERHDMKVIGQPLIHGGSIFLPDWLMKGSYTDEQLTTMLHDYVSTVIDRYKGKVHIWELVTEYNWMMREPDWDLDFWYNRLGSEYPEMVFTWARQADPDAILLLTEPELEDRHHPLRAAMIDRTLTLVRKLLDKGIPIDGIGIQGHLLLNTPSPTREGLMETIELFGGLGLDVYITEFDVNLADTPGSQEERREVQAQLYQEMLEACLESEYCRGFITFEFSDKYTWLGDCDECLGLIDPQPLPFDSDYQAKPAYYSMVEVLVEHYSSTVDTIDSLP